MRATGFARRSGEPMLADPDPRGNLNYNARPKPKLQYSELHKYKVFKQIDYKLLLS